MWRIVCYNNTNEVVYENNVVIAIEKFLKKHKLHAMDIKYVINMDDYKEMKK